MADAPASVRWDQSAARTHAAPVAAAANLDGRIVLSFGARLGEDAPGQEQRAILQRRIALEPATAKALHDMLSRLIAEAG